MQKAKQFLESLVSQLVTDPSAIFVEEKTDEMGVLLTLHVAAVDMGKIIGKSGETAKAIRTLLRVCGSLEKARINLKIAEPEGGRVSNRPDDFNA